MAVLFRNGTVYTGHSAQPYTDALAVHAGRVVAFGDEAEQWAVSWDDVIDIGDGCVYPGFRDGHAHPVSGGLDSVTLSLHGATSLDDLLQTIGRYAANNPDLDWIRGFRYPPSILPDGVGDARWLDAVCPERPVALTAADGHVLWANTRALELAGIDAHTPDTPFGTIMHRPDGSPCGTLREFEAMDLVRSVMPPLPPEVHRRGLRAGMEALQRHGIVWVQDAIVDADLLARYIDAAEHNGLGCRINAAFRADPDRWVAQRNEFMQLRAALDTCEAARGWLTGHTVKFFADGIIEAGTGLLLEPYDDAPHTCGLPNWSPAAFAEAVAAFDHDGFQIHIHAIGDGGVRMALDAIEHAVTRNGRRDRRPVIAHTQLVHSADRPRFAQLGVIANFEPLWAQLDPIMTDLTIPRLGPERSAMQYPIASLARHGARVSFGSDWPVSSVNPLAGLAVAVSRLNARGEPIGGWLPEERVAIHDAIAAYTSGTAFQAYDDDAGRLIPGGRADLCILSSDISAMNGAEIADVSVRSTWIGGQRVWGGS